MRLKAVLILNAIFSLLNAIGALFLPAKILSIYGVAQGASVELMAQYAAIGSVVIALIAFYASKIENSEAKKVIILALFVSGVIGVILSVLNTANNNMNSSGWSLAFVYLFFTVVYGYFLFIKKTVWKTSEIL